MTARPGEPTPEWDHDRIRARAHTDYETCWHMQAPEIREAVADEIYPGRCREVAAWESKGPSLCFGRPGHDGGCSNTEAPGTPCHYCGELIPPGAHGFVSCPNCWRDVQPGDLAELYAEAWARQAERGEL